MQPHCSFYTAARSCQACLAFLVWSVWGSESQRAPIFLQLFHHTHRESKGCRSWHRLKRRLFYEPERAVDIKHHSKPKSTVSKRESEMRGCGGWSGNAQAVRLLREAEVMCFPGGLMPVVSGQWRFGGKVNCVKVNPDLYLLWNSDSADAKDRLFIHSFKETSQI